MSNLDPKAYKNGLPVTTDAAGEPTPVPQPKVVAAASGAVVGGAISTIGIYAFEGLSGIDLPQPVEGAVLTLIVAGVAFAAGYIKRPSGIN